MSSFNLMSPEQRKERSVKTENHKLGYIAAGVVIGFGLIATYNSEITEIISNLIRSYQ